jgi:sensor domain DACNV-containing protein
VSEVIRTRTTDPSYPAARVVAAKVRDHLLRDQRERMAEGSGPQPEVPDADVIEAVIDAAFWASLRREEGYVPRMSLAIIAREIATEPLVFERGLRLAADGLVRVSAAVERPGRHLAVWPVGEELCVWGTVQAVPTSSCVIEVSAPGLLVIKHRPTEQSGKFVNIAVLEGDQVKVIDESASRLADCPPLVSALLGFDPPTTSRVDKLNVLVELSVSMRAHGRGGSLLVVPSDGALWRESIVHPVSYEVSPRFPVLAHLLRVPKSGRDASWVAEVDRAVDMIAGLTAIDGATIVTDQYELVAFGAKIANRDGYARAERVVVTEPIEGEPSEVIHPTSLGGTRHLSAVQFAQDQKDSIALVASQDGRFTVFAWSPCEQMVHAHRVETLLL